MFRFAALAAASLALTPAAASAAKPVINAPAVGHVTIAVLKAKVPKSSKLAKGRVPRPVLPALKNAPDGVEVIGAVGRKHGDHRTLYAVLFVINRTPKSGGRAHAADGTFNIATGLQWAPLRYTFPVGPAACGAADDGSTASCSRGALYGWQTTRLDNYLGFFFHPQLGTVLALDLGYQDAPALIDVARQILVAPSGTASLDFFRKINPPPDNPFSCTANISAFSGRNDELVLSFTCSRPLRFVRIVGPSGNQVTNFLPPDNWTPTPNANMIDFAEMPSGPDGTNWVFHVRWADPIAPGDASATASESADGSSPVAAPPS